MALLLLMPWQLKDQKGHVLSLIYTLAWQVSTVASCDKRHSRRTSAPPPPAATKPDPRATSRVSQICITNVSFSGCLTLHNPFQHANPLKVIGRASTRPRDRPGTVSSRAAASGRDGFISYFLWQHLRTICITKQTMRVVLFIGIQNLMPRPLAAPSPRLAC